MSTNRQIFRDNRTTTGAKFSRVPWVNLYHGPSSFYRFGVRELYKLTPGYVTNALVNPMVAVRLHLLNVEFFKDDQPETIDQLPAFLVSKVGTPVLDAGMDVVKRLNSLAAFRRSLIEFAYLALDTFQVGFVTLNPAFTLNLITIRQRGKGGQTKINANHIRGYGQGLRLNDTGEASVPITESVALNRKSFTLALDRPVKNDFDIAYLGQVNLTIVKESPVTFFLWIRKTIVPVERLKARITRLAATFDTLKESPESQVDTLLSVLHCLGVSLLEKFIIHPPQRQELVGIIPAQRLLFILPGVLSDFKRFVVHKAASTKLSLQALSLRFGWKNPKLKCLTHISIISQPATQYKFCVDNKRIHLPVINREPSALDSVEIKNVDAIHLVGRQWYVEIRGWEAWANTAPHAICLAALKAVGGA
jgi:hypothetical protein